MNQHALDRAVAEATRESVDTISRLGFSLLSLPSKNPLYIPTQRKRPLRLAHEVRRRKRPRHSPKSMLRSFPSVRPVARYSDNADAIRAMPCRRLAFFDRGA